MLSLYLYLKAKSFQGCLLVEFQVPPATAIVQMLWLTVHFSAQPKTSLQRSCRAMLLSASTTRQRLHRHVRTW